MDVSKCPECQGEMVERKGGMWCPRCKGWLAPWRWEGSVYKTVLWTATKP